MFASAAMQGAPPMDGPLQFDLIAYMPIPQGWSQKKRAAAVGFSVRPTTKPDIDNVLKLVADSVNHIVWNDDSQIVQLTARKFYSDTPRVEVIVTQLEQPQ